MSPNLSSPASYETYVRENIKPRPSILS